VRCGCDDRSDDRGRERGFQFLFIKLRIRWIGFNEHWPRRKDRQHRFERKTMP
jgi:hypothetical protein